MTTATLAPLAGSPAETGQAALARRLQARDPQALAELYDQCGAWIYRSVLPVVRESTAAENVTQEAFLHVWNRIATFDAARGSLVSWLRVVARNLAIDYIRSSESRMARRTAPLEFAEGRPAASPAECRVAQWDRVRLLEGPWSRLRACDRQALHLAYYGGLSQTEIAERLRRPLGTVKSWMRRGLASLRADLESAHASW